MASVIALAAITPALGESLEVSTTVGFESRYVFRGLQFAETSVQPEITLGYRNFYLGAWFNLPVGDDVFSIPITRFATIAGTSADELDLYFGYSAPLDDLITIDLGVTYYTFPDLMSGFTDVFREDGSGLGWNTLEPYVGLSLDTVLAPSLYVYHDFFLDTTTIEGGVSHSFPLDNDGTFSFDLGGSVGYVFDDDAGGDYLYGALSYEVSYAVSENASISAGGRYGGSDIPGGALIDNFLLLTTQSAGLWWGGRFSSNF
jgi:uncharacterized protein (TIGR02001 family)